MCRLDSVVDEILGVAQRPLLKIDTQGYESHVLEGARQALGRFAGVQMELSIELLYAEGAGYLEMLELLENKGFQLMGIEPGFSDAATGQLLQFDGVFFRPQAVEP